jgi:uncharacterized protein (DUF58 family)
MPASDAIPAGDIASMLRRIRRLEIHTRQLVETAFAGRYHSVFKGRGINFEEVREYQPGDEIRSIDWNVTARSGRPHIKKFTEERELAVLLAVDVSASGEFGSSDRSKREIAAEVAAVLAFSAIRNNDKVGLLLFSDGVELYLPPRKGRSHVLRAVREVLFHQPRAKGTSLRQALEFLNRTTARRAVLFLISDFQDTGFERALAVTARHHDVIALPVADPREGVLPPVGWITLEDSETGETRHVDTRTAKAREKFAQAVAERTAVLDRLFTRLAIDSVPLQTGADYLPALRAFFRRRQRRRARE